MRVRFYLSSLRSVGTVQRDMERMMQSWWDWHGTLPRNRYGIWNPPTDVYETATDLVVKIEMPGTTEDQIEIVLYQDSIVVSGQRKDREEDEPARTLVHQMDIWYGQYQVQIPITIPIDYERVEADYRNGMIYITLPKLPEATKRPTHIPISSFVPGES